MKYKSSGLRSDNLLSDNMVAMVYCHLGYDIRMLKIFVFIQENCVDSGVPRQSIILGLILDRRNHFHLVQSCSAVTLDS